jgi:hypothetical protein
MPGMGAGFRVRKAFLRCAVAAAGSNSRPMSRYTDFVERVFLAEGMLKAVLPKDILDREVWRRVRDAEPGAVFGDGSAERPETLKLLRGALLYALDDLDGCHGYFQDAPGDLGSYWHAMMHRREGDFDNARYWYRRAGRLPFFDTLHHEAAVFSADMARQDTWSPYLFTGKCEQHRFGAEDERGELVRLQKAEFEVTFEYTWRQAGLPQAG